MKAQEFPVFMKRYEDANKAYAEKDYDLSIKVIESIAKDFPELSTIMQVEIAQLLCCKKEYEAAIENLIKVKDHEDFWMIDDYFTTKDLKPIIDDERVIEIRKIVKERTKIKSEGPKGIYHLYPDNPAQLNKLVVILHGNHFFNPMKNTRETFIKDIEPLHQLINKEATFCSIVSPRLGYLGFPFWYDYDEDGKTVGELLEEIKHRYDLTDNDLYVYGYSAGAGVALSGVLHGHIKVKNICLFCPALVSLKEQTELIHTLDKNKVKFFIYSGTEDRCLPFAESFDEILNKTDISHQLLVEKDQNHRLIKGPKKLITASWEFFK